MAMNINLTPQLEEVIRRKVTSGSYNSASEVVREALRLMEHEDRVRAIQLQRLRQDIEEGLTSGPALVFDPLDLKRNARRSKNIQPARNIKQNGRHKNAR